MLVIGHDEQLNMCLSESVSDFITASIPWSSYLTWFVCIFRV